MGWKCLFFGREMHHEHGFGRRANWRTFGIRRDLEI